MNFAFVENLQKEALEIIQALDEQEKEFKANIDKAPITQLITLQKAVDKGWTYDHYADNKFHMINLRIEQMLIIDVDGNYKREKI